MLQGVGRFRPMEGGLGDCHAFFGIWPSWPVSITIWVLFLLRLRNPKKHSPTISCYWVKHQNIVDCFLNYSELPYVPGVVCTYFSGLDQLTKPFSRLFCSSKRSGILDRSRNLSPSGLGILAKAWFMDSVEEGYLTGVSAYRFGRLQEKQQKVFVENRQIFMELGIR